MGVNPRDADSEQAVLVQKVEDFMMIRRDRRRQPLQVAEDLGPGLQITAGDLAASFFLRFGAPISLG